MPWCGSTATDTALLVHPLGPLEVKQLKVPLETRIDRIGSSPVTTPRVNLAAPVVGGQPAAAVSHSTDLFPPGHFITMTADQQAARPDFESFPCGMRIAASSTPQHGGPVSATYAWDTVYPHQDFERHLLAWDLKALARTAMYTGPVAAGARARGNPYMPPTPPTPGDSTLKLGDSGLVTIRDDGDLKVSAGPAGGDDHHPGGATHRRCAARDGGPAIRGDGNGGMSGSLSKSANFVADAFRLTPAFFYQPEDIVLGQYAFAPYARSGLSAVIQSPAAGQLRGTVAIGATLQGESAKPRRSAAPWCCAARATWRPSLRNR